MTVEFDGKAIITKFPSSKEKTIVELKKLEEKISKEESNYCINLRTAERKGRRERHSFRHFKDELQRPKNFSGMVQIQRSQDRKSLPEKFVEQVFVGHVYRCRMGVLND